MWRVKNLGAIWLAVSLKMQLDLVFSSTLKGWFTQITKKYSHFLSYKNFKAATICPLID